MPFTQGTAWHMGTECGDVLPRRNCGRRDTFHRALRHFYRACAKSGRACRTQERCQRRAGCKRLYQGAHTREDEGQADNSRCFREPLLSLEDKLFHRFGQDRQVGILHEVKQEDNSFGFLNKKTAERCI